MGPHKTECYACDGAGGKVHRGPDVEIFEPCRRCQGSGHEPTKRELLVRIERLERRVQAGKALAVAVIKEAVDPETPETPLAGAAMHAWETLNVFDRGRVKDELGVENIRTRITGGEALA